MLRIVGNESAECLTQVKQPAPLAFYFGNTEDGPAAGSA